MLKNSPPKVLWRAISVQTTVIKPAETTLAGENVRGQLEIHRQIHFDGESRHELRTPETNR
ncbi:hypothetical protein SDC9_165542 [bioreactor metagenome]|jgi:hypothetical protein|uniref:Uncharacterized protein n=1 Tax=bioreactor metagenome TaxID=1076179 RepID=A0A645G217_9ZZZZ